MPRIKVNDDRITAQINFSSQSWLLTSYNNAMSSLVCRRVGLGHIQMSIGMMLPIADFLSCLSDQGIQFLSRLLEHLCPTTHHIGLVALIKLRKL